MTVIRCSPDDDLNGLTLSSYRCLVSFLVERDNELNLILEKSWTSFDSYCGCVKPWEDVYGKTKETLRKPYIRMEEVYHMALEARVGNTCAAACSYSQCTLNAKSIREFIDWMFEERKKVCDKFM